MGLTADRAALRRLNSPDVTVEEVVEIFSDTIYGWDVLTEAVRHPLCTLPALKHVLDIGSDGILDRIAMDSQDPEVLQYLVWKGPSERRAIVAYNADTPPWLLDQLARDPDPTVRLNVHVNPATPPEAVALLESDDDADVREAREYWWTQWDKHRGGLLCRVWRLRLALMSRMRRRAQ
jgi:hypothetical protein